MSLPWEMERSMGGREEASQRVILTLISFVRGAGTEQRKGKKQRKVNMSAGVINRALMDLQSVWHCVSRPASLRFQMDLAAADSIDDLSVKSLQTTEAAIVTFSIVSCDDYFSHFSHLVSNRSDNTEKCHFLKFKMMSSNGLFCLSLGLKTKKKKRANLHIGVARTTKCIFCLEWLN